MKIIEVDNNKQLQKDFVRLPSTLYKDDPNWICPLDKDIEAIFDPKQNAFFQHGQCIRWISKDDNNQVIGRVAAFINEKSVNKDNLQPTGGMGFFECIENEEVAFALFDACKKWLEEKGMKAMDGPINFGERNKWWGLLIKGFHPPSYCMPYNKKYYRAFFENYGFQDYFQQYTYLRELRPKNENPGVVRRYERIKKKKAYRFEHVKAKEMDRYMEDFRVIFNAAWAGSISGVSEMSKEESKVIFKQLKPIFDERLLWFGYFEEKPIAFFIMIPEINQIFQHLNGKLDLIGKLKFLYYKWSGACNKILGLVFGVLPDFQGRGLEAALALAFADFMKSHPEIPYHEIELNWIGDFNPRMVKLVEMIGFKVHKTHITYRKLFDETIPFQRAPRSQ